MGERFNKLKICILIIFFISLINPASSQTAEEWNNKGFAFTEAGEYDKAIEAYNKAIAIDPYYEVAWNNKGVVFLELEEYNKAIEAFDRSIIINPNDKEVWFIKGTALAGLGEYDQAIEANNKALAIDPNYKEAWYGKAVAFLYLDKYKEVIEASDRALAIDPNDSGVLTTKGYGLAGLGEYDQAIEAYNKALAIDPNDEGAWYGKAIAFYELGEDEKAVEAYHKALDIDETKSIESNNWIIISGAIIFILIGLFALRNKIKNKSKDDVFKNTNVNSSINKWKMFCQKCGAELKEDSNFCGSCGFPLQKEIIKEEKKSVSGKFLELLKLSFKWSGRFNRRQFMLIFFGGNLTIFLTGIILYIIGFGEELIFGFMYLEQYLFILILAGTVVRRLHDMDYSGWYGLLSLIPFVNFVLLLFLLFDKGNKIGETRWG